MRDQGTGWDPKAPASIHRARAALDASGNVIAYDFLSKGFSRVDVEHQRQQAEGYARRTDSRRRAQVGRRLRRAGRFLRLRQQAHRLGDDRAAARPRFAAAQRAHARSGRAANPFRQRIVHRRSGCGAQHRSGRVPPALRARSARHRRHQGGGGEGRLAVAAVAAQRSDAATRSPAAASPMRSAGRRASR